MNILVTIIYSLKFLRYGAEKIECPAGEATI